MPPSFVQSVELLIWVHVVPTDPPAHGDAPLHVWPSYTFTCTSGLHVTPVAGPQVHGEQIAIGAMRPEPPVHAVLVPGWHEGGSEAPW